MKIIDGDALKEEFSKRLWFVSSPQAEAQAIMDIINNAPTIHHPNCDTCEGLAKQYSMGFQDGFLTGKERPQGEWITIKEIMFSRHACSLCHQYPLADEDTGETVLSNFCPNCGAKMQKGGAE